MDRRVRALAWREELRARLGPNGQVVWKEDYGDTSRPEIDISNPFQLLSLLTSKREPSRPDPSIAIIHADGMLVRGKSGRSLLGGRYVGHKTLVGAFEDVRQDDNVKAVIFRVHSPGGSALASELIYQAVRRCDRRKPVIASVSDLAASGGYYIAAGARRVYADPSALVGSIGVVSGKLATTELLEKLRIGVFTLTRGRNAGLGLSRPWTDRERRTVRKLARRTYQRFVRRVRESRGKRIGEVGQVAKGRIFLADAAVKNGLVDGLGGLREAAAAARKAAGVREASYITLPRPRTLADVLSGDARSAIPGLGAAESLALRRLGARGDALKYLLQLSRLFDEESVLAAMPYYLSVRR